MVNYVGKLAILGSAENFLEILLFAYFFPYFNGLQTKTVWETLFEKLDYFESTLSIVE